jgi:hypothetical protein
MRFVLLPPIVLLAIMALIAIGAMLVSAVLH